MELRIHLVFLSALQAEALQTKVASEVIAELSLFNHLVAMGAHLQRFAGSRYIILLIEVLLAGLVPVPGFLGQIAKIEGAFRTLLAVVMS